MRRDPGPRTRIPRIAVTICAVLVAAVGAGVAGCQNSQHKAALPHASCGSAITHSLIGDTHLLHADPGALTCFVRAARECMTASLRVTEMGVDTGTEYVFAIKSGKTSCQFTELRQHYSANFGGSQSAVSTVSCRRTAVTLSGVALRCGGKDVLIPAKVSAPSSHSA
jgi:hypothetical protein